MSLAHVFGPQLGSPSIPNFTPIVFVVDEDVSVRASLERLILSTGWQPETFASVQEFLARPRPVVPSCLILALSLPDRSGVELQKRIARERPEVPIIVISDYGDIPSTVEVMKAGAVDFLEKPISHNVLLAGIRECLEHSRLMLDREMQLRDLRNYYASLTPRERQVMTLVVAGFLNKQVGGELGISEITVKAHRGQVMQKMKANSLADLVRMAGKIGSARHAIHLA
jgi:FixJ family two-component response regulator